MAGLVRGGQNQELQAAMATAGVPPKGKDGILSFDECKIKEGLVLDPHSNELVGE